MEQEDTECVRKECYDDKQLQKVQRDLIAPTKHCSDMCDPGLNCQLQLSCAW